MVLTLPCQASAITLAAGYGPIESTRDEKNTLAGHHSARQQRDAQTLIPILAHGVEEDGDSAVNTLERSALTVDTREMKLVRKY